MLKSVKTLRANIMHRDMDRIGKFSKIYFMNDVPCQLTVSSKTTLETQFHGCFYIKRTNKASLFGSWHPGIYVVSMWSDFMGCCFKAQSMLFSKPLVVVAERCLGDPRENHLYGLCQGPSFPCIFACSVVWYWTS
jgi:hypothetical protein